MSEKNDEDTTKESENFVPRIANRETPNTRLFEEVWELHHLGDYPNNVSSDEEKKSNKQNKK